jgi:hypothetical protein
MKTGKEGQRNKERKLKEDRKCTFMPTDIRDVM